MATETRKVVIVATPTAPALKQLLHLLSHTEFQVNLITRPTSISFSSIGHTHNQDHNHDGQTGRHSILDHHQTTDLSTTSLCPLFRKSQILITLLTGADINITSKLITAACEARVPRFLPSEYGLDTSNSALRDLLPPYQTRWKIQEELRRSEIGWTALYTASILEESLKSEGVLGVDVPWGSVSAFGGREAGGEREIVLSTYSDIARAILSVMQLSDEDWKLIDGQGVYVSRFITNLEEIIEIVQRVDGRGREFDWYEAVGDLARKEAADRMRMGYFDGGVALMTKVAVWDDAVHAMAGWKKDGGQGNKLLGMGDGESLEVALRRVVEDIKEGKDDTGCGC